MSVESELYIPVRLVKGDTESVLPSADPIWNTLGSVAIANPSLRSGETYQAGFQVSTHHGRGIEYLSTVSIEPRMGPDGRLRSSYNIKGGVLFDPFIKVSRGRTLGSGIAINGVEGIYDVASAKEAVRKTRILHDRQFPIDWVLDVQQYKKIRVEEKSYEPAEFIRMLLSDVKGKVVGDLEFGGYTSSELKQMREYLLSMEFGLLWRATEVAERFADFSVGTKQDFFIVLHRAIDFINMQERVDAKDESRDPKYFLYEGDYAFRYLIDYFPKALGKSYGRLHGELGVTHTRTNAHSQNWLTTGSLIDPDGMKGTLFGDRPRDSFDVRNDLSRILEVEDLRLNDSAPPTLGFIIHRLLSRGYIGNGQMTEKEKMEIIKQFVSNFRNEYSVHVQNRLKTVINEVAKI